jgi:lipid-A-disaccharide synthase
MREGSGGGVRDWVGEAAVLGLWEVLKRYRWFRACFEETRREIAALGPDAVVFVDYPGFNLRLARVLRRSGLPSRLVNYISPQVWAWNRSRIPRMAEWLDLMLCLFPFEKQTFEEAGLRTVCMGHPLVDQLEAERISGGREGDLVGLFPGPAERCCKG